MIGEEFDGQLSYTPISKANVRMFDKVRITRVNKKKFNIYDKNDRVNRSKLNNKEFINDVFINVDYGFSYLYSRREEYHKLSEYGQKVIERQNMNVI
jgi:hypothetical protein